MNLLYRIFLIYGAMLLAGCSTLEQLQQKIHDNLSSKHTHMIEAKHQFQQSIVDDDTRQRAQEVDKPWFTGIAQPLARELRLPDALKNNIDTTLMFNDGLVDLSTLADRIILVTGIPVRVQPDALLPQAHFTSHLGELSVPVSGSQGHASQLSLPLGKHPLMTLLDLISSRFGVYWRYEDGAIEFFRTETRSFNVRALTLKTSTSVALGRSNNQGTGVFESRGSTRLEAENTDALQSVKEKIIPFMTRAGVIVANGDASNMIVVTDTRDALNRIDVYLAKENRALTRRVRLLFERIEVQLKDNVEQGIDWNVLAGVLSFTAPNSLVTAAASRLDVTRTNGSSVVVTALNEIGRVVSHTTVPLQGLNRRPMTHAVRTTFTYIDQVQTTTVASSAGTSTSPSVTQKEETVGSFLTVVPDAQEDGQILLSVSYDNTVALPLKTLTFGGNGNELFLQQKTIDGIGTVQQVQVQAGQPIVISGFERTQEQSDRRTLDASLPMILGGSGQSSTERIVTLVILTAQVEEGI